jgi:dienelactone hydrolase
MNTSGSAGGSGTSSGTQAGSGSSVGNPADGGPSPIVDAAPFTTDASITGCGSTKLLAVPDDPSVRGPWDVGVKTVTIGRLTAEVFYPAMPGSTTGVAEATYDLRQWLPKDQQAKVKDMYATPLPAIGGHLFRGVAIDGNYGPYPAVLTIHGTASIRVASLSTYVQWASRGFVVVSADYPGLYLTDELCATTECKSGSATIPASTSCGTVGTQDVPTDVKTQITALTAPSGDLAFLTGHVDMSRIGITGHSQGACIAAGLTTDANVQIVLPMAGAENAITSSTLKSVIFIAGMDDTVIGYNSTKIGNLVCAASGAQTDTSDTGAYQASPGSPVVKRLVGITGGGHMSVTDLCQNNSRGNNSIQESSADMVCGIGQAAIIGLPTLFDCGTVTLANAVKAVNYASTAALEETLHCQDRSKQFTNLKTAVPVVGDFQHTP